MALISLMEPRFESYPSRVRWIHGDRYLIMYVALGILGRQPEGILCPSVDLYLRNWIFV